MSEYPILVADWDDKRPADLAICERCRAEFTWNPEEGDPYDLCVRHAAPYGVRSLTSSLGGGFCRGQIHMKWVTGDQCRGCGKLDYSLPRELDGCCSRKCMLQAEYAEQLKARGPAA